MIIQCKAVRVVDDLKKIIQNHDAILAIHGRPDADCTVLKAKDMLDLINSPLNLEHTVCFLDLDDHAFLEKYCAKMLTAREPDSPDTYQKYQ